MPFVSERQKRYLYANEPDMARRWEKHGMKGKVVDASIVHTLVFDKAAFKTKRTVREWLVLRGYRASYVVDHGGEWRARQGADASADIGEGRINVAPSVQAIVGTPKLAKNMGSSPLPLMPPIGGASGPGDKTPAMPDFASLYAQPEAQKRMDQEAEQSLDRRRSMWRDYNFAGFHGIGAPDKPVLRYIDGVTSTADIVNKQPQAHYLTGEQLRQNQKRIQTGTGLGYETVQGQTGNRKKGRV